MVGDKHVKLSCSPVELGSALQIVSRAVATKSTLPVLANVLMQAEGSQLVLTANNLELGLRCKLGAEVASPGAVTVPARLLTDFVNSLPDQELQLELDEPTLTVHLTCGSFDAHIKGLDAAEFPALPALEGATTLQFNAELLRESLAQVVFAASTDEGRPVLTGVLVHISGSEVTFAATDGHRLAVKRAKLTETGKGPTEPESLIVPARALSELARVIKPDDGPVQVILPAQRNQVWFRTGSIELVARLIEGTYPNYQQVIPSAPSTSVALRSSDLLRQARAVSYFARDSANVLRLQVEDSTLSLRANTPEVGDSVSQIQVAVEGSPLQIAFNSEDIRLEFTGPLSPGLLRPAEGHDYQHVIMPVRVAM
jgi:DNA polymerase-3 subunit beta